MMLTLSAPLSPALSAAPPGSTHSTLAPCPQSSEATPTTRSPNLGQYSTVQYSTVQCSTVQYSTVQCSTVQYSTARIAASPHLADTMWPELFLVTPPSSSL